MELTLLRPLPSEPGVVSQWFGENPALYARFGLAGHNGLDYAATEGTLVLAAHAGRCNVGYDPQGYGWHIRIGADNQECLTLYAHLKAVLVGENQYVAAGETIGTLGSTGFSTGPHLHFGLRLLRGRNPAYRDWVDPVPFRTGC